MLRVSLRPPVNTLAWLAWPTKGRIASEKKIAGAREGAALIWSEERSGGRSCAVCGCPHIMNSNPTLGMEFFSSFSYSVRSLVPLRSFAPIHKM